MSIFTEPNQGGNPMVSPIVQKAIDLMNKKKAQQPIVAAPEVIKNQIKTGLTGNEPQVNNMPQIQPNNVVPNPQMVAPQINQEYRGEVTDAYRSNNPDYTPLTTDKQVIKNNPSISNVIEENVVTPKTSKDFLKLPKEKQEQLKQELADAGHWDVNEKFDAEKALNSFYASQPAINTPATQTTNSSSSSSSTSTEEKTYPTFDEYVAASGLNPVNQIIESIKPVRKEADEERLKKIAAANAIGDGLRLIGDAAYGDKGSIGANIPKRDNKYTFKAIEDMRALKDKYDKESKDYGMLKLQQLQNMRREWLSDKTRKESAQASKEAATTKMLFDADQNKKKMDNAMAIAKLKGGYAQRIAAARASAGGGGTKNRTTLLHKGSNKVIPIDNSYFNDILSQVLAEKSAKGEDKEANAILDSMIKDPSQTKAKALVQENWEKWYKPNKDYSGIEPKDNTMSNSEYAVRKKNALSNKSNDNIINSFKENSYITLNDAKNVLNNIKSDSKLSKEQKKQLYYEMLLETGNIDGQDISEDEAYTIANELLND